MIQNNGPEMVVQFGIKHVNFNVKYSSHSKICKRFNTSLQMCKNMCIIVDVQ